MYHVVLTRINTNGQKNAARWGAEKAYICSRNRVEKTLKCQHGRKNLYCKIQRKILPPPPNLPLTVVDTDEKEGSQGSRVREWVESEEWGLTLKTDTGVPEFVMLLCIVTIDAGHGV